MFLSKHLMKAKVTSSLLNMTSVRSVAFVKGDLGKLKEKGKAEEDIYFSQQESKSAACICVGETIKRLLKKMEDQAERAKAQDNDEDKEQKHDKLDDIFKKHGIKENKGLINELNEWKKSK